MATYDINYKDERFTQVESDKKAALNEAENTYGGMIKDSDKYYQAQIDASKEWESTQQKIQNEQTDFAIEKIEQQKDQAKKDYTKEQSGAYVDWQKQSNDYGVKAEQNAANGMQNSGFSESSQVSMYNTYQNRVSTARESYNNAILNYNNAIKDARLQNNSKLAEIAYESLQKQLELSLQGFQYKNQLLLDQANKKLEIENNYYNRYQDVLKQINTENALAEQIRQYNESLAEQKRQHNENLAEQKRQFDFKNKIGDYKSSGSSNNSSNNSPTNGDKPKDSGKIQKGKDASGYKPSSNITKNKSTKKNTTYSKAVRDMERKGVPSSYASNILTEGEWKRAKAAGSSRYGAKDFNSYSDYVKSAVAYNTDPAVKKSRKKSSSKKTTTSKKKKTSSIFSKSIFGRF